MAIRCLRCTSAVGCKSSPDRAARHRRGCTARAITVFRTDGASSVIGVIVLDIISWIRTDRIRRRRPRAAGIRYSIGGHTVAACDGFCRRGVSA